MATTGQIYSRLRTVAKRWIAANENRAAADLAMISEISESQLSRFLRDQDGRQLSLDSLVKLGKALDLRLAWVPKEAK